MTVNVLIRLPSLTFHRRTVLSFAPETIYFPSGLNAMPRTARVCPFRSRTTLHRRHSTGVWSCPVAGAGQHLSIGRPGKLIDCAAFPQHQLLHGARLSPYPIKRFWDGRGGGISSGWRFYRCTCLQGHRRDRQRWMGRVALSCQQSQLSLPVRPGTVWPQAMYPSAPAVGLTATRPRQRAAHPQATATPINTRVVFGHASMARSAPLKAARNSPRSESDFLA